MTELIKPNVTTSALCIVLPSYMVSYVDDFRNHYDKAYKRWPPHINLIFPFLNTNEFPEIKTKLEAAFKEESIKEFTMKLDTVDYFKQADEITIHAKPKYCPELTKIYNTIVQVLNIETGRDFIPHLTLGQFDKSAMSANKVTEIKASWGSGLCVSVSSLQLVARDNSPDSRFNIVDEIQLSN